MMPFADFGFLHPGWLLLLPPAWWLVRRYTSSSTQRSAWHKLCDARLLGAMRAGSSREQASDWLGRTLYALLTLAIVAAAGPSWRQQSGPGLESASARVVVVEMSSAMLVRDVEPDRISQALAAAREIVASDFSGETGLVVYAGAAFVVAPLSRDSSTLLAFLDALEPAVMPVQGSRVDLGIERARDLLLATPDQGGQILLIGSGLDDRSRAEAAAAAAAADGHQVSILAIGTAAGGPVIGEDGSLLRDDSGRFLLSRTAFDDLQRVATAGRGVLLRLTRATEYDALLGSRILAGGLVESGSDFETGKRPPANEGYWLVWMMLPFALLLFRRNLLWVMLIAIVMPTGEGVHAAGTADIWKHREQLAYDAYTAGRFDDAGRLSRDPILKGAALYRDGDYSAAAEAFAGADEARAHYNLGNALVHLDRLEAALEAYERALQFDPGMADARYNRRMIEYFLEQEKLTASSDSQDGTEGELAGDAQDQSAGEGRVGVLGEQSLNPADQPRLEPGLGASQQSGSPNPGEQYDPYDQPPDRFALRNQSEAQRAQERVDDWIRNLPLTSTELFQRKFLRDHQRQKQQAR